MGAFHNSPPDSSKKSAEIPFLPVEVRHALSAWIRVKESLERAMRREDFNSLVRPMYLLVVLSGSCMLLALPPNKRLAERARNFRPNLAAAIERQNYHLAGFCRYPSDEELLELRGRLPWAPYVEMIYRKRLAAIEARKLAEDARDCADLNCADLGQVLTMKDGLVEVRA